MKIKFQISWKLEKLEFKKAGIFIILKIPRAGNFSTYLFDRKLEL
jgi:hypothetical protein